MALTDRDVQAIRAVVERDAEAVRRADWEAVTHMFTVDAIRFPPHQPPVRGRDAMRAWLETFPPIDQFDITADEIVGCGDLAFVRGGYVLTIAPQAGEPPQTDRGHYMGLLRKQTNGSWLWATDMVSSELPLPGWENRDRQVSRRDARAPGSQDSALRSAPDSPYNV